MSVKSLQHLLKSKNILRYNNIKYIGTFKANELDKCWTYNIRNEN